MPDSTSIDSLIISVSYDTLIVNGRSNHYLLSLLQFFARSFFPFTLHIISLSETELPVSIRETLEEKNIVPIFSVFDQTEANNNSFNNSNFLTDEGKKLNLLTKIQQNNVGTRIIHLDHQKEVIEQGQLSADASIKFLKFMNQGNPWSTIYDFLYEVGFVKLLSSSLEALLTREGKEAQFQDETISDEKALGLVGESETPEVIFLYLWMYLFAEKKLQTQLSHIIEGKKVFTNSLINEVKQTLISNNEAALFKLYNFEFEKIVYFQMKENKTPLQYIIGKGLNSHSAAIFLDGNFESKEIVNSSKENALHTAMKSSIDKALVLRLLQAGYDPADQDAKGNNALYHGIQGLQNDLINHLPIPDENTYKTQFKIALLQPNQENQTPLHLAISIGNLTAFQELLNLAAEVKLDVSKLRGPDKENPIFSILKRLDAAPKGSKLDFNVGKMLVAMMKVTPPTVWEQWMEESYKGKSFDQYVSAYKLPNQWVLMLKNPVLYKWAESVCSPSLKTLVNKTNELKSAFDIAHNKLLRNQAKGMAEILISIEVMDLEAEIKKADEAFQTSNFYRDWSGESKKFLTQYYPYYLHAFFTTLFDSYENTAKNVILQLGNICLLSKQTKIKSDLPQLVKHFMQGEVLEFSQVLLELEQTQQINLKEVDNTHAEEKNLAIILANRTINMSAGSRQKAVTMLAILATKGPELFYLKNPLHETALSILATVGIPFELMMIGISHCVQVCESVLEKLQTSLAYILELSKSNEEQLRLYLSKSRSSGIPQISSRTEDFSNNQEKAAYERFFKKLSHTVQTTAWESINSRYAIEVNKIIRPVPLTIQEIDKVNRSLSKESELNDYKHAFNSLKIALEESNNFRFTNFFFRVRQPSSKEFYKKMIEMCNAVKEDGGLSLNEQTDQFDSMMQSVTRLIK